MKYCKACGYLSEENISECPYCGETLVVKPSKVSASKSPVDEAVDMRSAFAKYAEFIDEETLYRAAVMKLDGLGMERNEEEAVEMLRVLAFKGHCDGMYKLAEYLLENCPSEKETAVTWLKIAAGNGHAPSKIKLQTLEVGKSDDSAISLTDDGSGMVKRVRAALPSIITVTASFAGKNGKTAWANGSGLIITGGYVITNAHVVTAKPKSVTARFEPSLDDREYNLLPLSVDVGCDVAILRFTGLKDKQVTDHDNLALRMGDLQYGEEVYTIGNPLGLGLSVSRGVISCPSRETDYPSGVNHVVQTDISANPGNSGGALLDFNNNVLGIVTYHPGAARGGIAMCVPTDYIVKSLNKLK